MTHNGDALIPFWVGALVNPVLEALFGNRTAACILLFLQCYGEGHAQRIAKTFGFGLNMTQRQLKRLEEQGVLVSRRLGNMRLFSFNERNPTVRNLQKLLEVELAALPEDDQQQYFRPSEIQASGGSSRQLRLETRVIPVPVPSPDAPGRSGVAARRRATAAHSWVLGSAGTTGRTGRSFGHGCVAAARQRGKASARG